LDIIKEEKRVTEAAIFALYDPGKETLVGSDSSDYV
jgi:hypothetical protein